MYLVHLATTFWFPILSGGGDDGNRTHDPLLAGQVLSQLSYTPILLMRFIEFPYRSLKIEQQVKILRLQAHYLSPSFLVLVYF